MENREIVTSDLFKQLNNTSKVTNGLSLSQICNITGLKPHDIQNWVKRGYIPHPVNKKYETKHLARILLIDLLRESMYIEDINTLMVYINGDVDDESDDTISEEELYLLMSNIIQELDKDYSKLEQVVDKTVKNKKLNKALKAMAYAYISSQMSNKSKTYLQAIKSNS